MSDKEPSKQPLEVDCPHCKARIVWSEQNPYRPFCSKRCHIMDLGAWADESHRIAGEPAMDEANLDILLAGSGIDNSKS